MILKVLIMADVHRQKREVSGCTNERKTNQWEHKDEGIAADTDRDIDGDRDWDGRDGVLPFESDVETQILRDMFPSSRAVYLIETFEVSWMNSLGFLVRSNEWAIMESFENTLM